MSMDSIKSSANEQPIAVLILGMAGAGKTTLTSKLMTHLKQLKKNCFSVNLDPAVYEPGFKADIDIRDNINYDDVKSQYSLGPNGAITTSLNLFTLQFDQVMKIISQKASENQYFIFDTPGQIEVFTWSASGTIISETLASSMPTVILYVMDTSRSGGVGSFLKNMLYACNVSLNYQMPFIAVFNKTDLSDSSKLEEWLKDFELVNNELNKEDSSRIDSSLFLALEEFYCDLKTVSISSTSGDGCDNLVEAVHEANQEFKKEYQPIYEKLRMKSNERISNMLEILRKMLPSECE